MSTREQQRTGYWLTPAGCVTSGGHTPHRDSGCRTCTVCGATISLTPEQMLARAVLGIAGGKDPQRYLDVAIAWREKWARLVEAWDACGPRAAELMDGRASIHTGETYAQARDRWEAYRLLLVEELRAPDGSLR